MKIEYKNYLIDPSTNATDRFDLSRTIIRTKKIDPNKEYEGPETYEAQEEMGYGMSLENCFQQIIVKETVLSFKESVVTVSEYLAQYKKEKEELEAQILKVSQIKIN